jgi:D-xylose transport system substrate-binding protein
MKNIIFNSLILSIVALILLPSCSDNNSIKVGFILPNLIDTRFQKEKDYFTTKVKELDGEAIVMNGDNNDVLQIQQANDLIREGVKVLVIACVNKYTAAQIVRNAHEKNIKVIAYERIIANCDLDYFISFDNVKVGELMANYALQKKPTGNYILLCGDKSDQNAIWVRQGYLNVLTPAINAGKIKIIYQTYVEDWLPANAEFEMNQCLGLSASAPDVILSSYDGMSSGAIRALERSKIDSLPIITGQNAELESCRNIVKGKQSITIYKAVKPEAETAATLAMQLARKEKVVTNQIISNGTKDVPSILLDPVLVDANNMKSVVIKDNFQKESEIYN